MQQKMFPTGLDKILDFAHSKITLFFEFYKHHGCIIRGIWSIIPEINIHKKEKVLFTKPITQHYYKMFTLTQHKSLTFTMKKKNKQN